MGLFDLGVGRGASLPTPVDVCLFVIGKDLTDGVIAVAVGQDRPQLAFVVGFWHRLTGASFDRKVRGDEIVNGVATEP